jgi:formate dehydrogenase assembly factor FdhD
VPRRTRSVDLTQVTEWEIGVVRRVEDCLAGEEPLEIRAGRRSLGVTLRTAGNDPELVAGLLFTEGIITRREQLRMLHRSPVSYYGTLFHIDTNKILITMRQRSRGNSRSLEFMERG